MFRTPHLACTVLAVAFFCSEPGDISGEEPATDATAATAASPTDSASNEGSVSASDQSSVSASDQSSVSASDESSVFSLPHVPLFLSLFVQGGYDDNFRTSQSAHGSWFTNEGATLSYTPPPTATLLSLHSGADLTYYPAQTGGGQSDNINAYVDGFLKHHVSERLKLDASVYATYRTEPDFGSNVGFESRQGNFFHTLETLSVTYNWSERVSTVTSDKFQLVRYENSGVAASLNRFQDTIGEELRFDVLHRGNTLVGEYRFEIIDYDTSARDSYTHFALVGFDQEFGPDLKLTLRGGGTFRSYSNDGSQINPQFESSLQYTGAHDSELSWNTSYGVEEPSATSVLSRTTFRTGIALKYSLTGRIGVKVSGNYHHDDNQGSTPTGPSTGMPTSGFAENAFQVLLEAHYAINRRFKFKLGFEHSEINSEKASRDYARYRYFAGFTFTY